MPVAGPVGLGSAALADELGVDALKIIGVDADQYLTDPEQEARLPDLGPQADGCDGASQSIKQAQGRILRRRRPGRHAEKRRRRTRAVPRSSKSAVSDELKSEIETISDGIKDGSIPVKG